MNEQYKGKTIRVVPRKHGKLSDDELMKLSDSLDSIVLRMERGECSKDDCFRQLAEAIKPGCTACGSPSREDQFMAAVQNSLNNNQPAVAGFNNYLETMFNGTEDAVDNMDMDDMDMDMDDVDMDDMGDCECQYYSKESSDTSNGSGITIESDGIRVQIVNKDNGCTQVICEMQPNAEMSLNIGDYVLNVSHGTTKYMRK